LVVDLLDGAVTAAYVPTALIPTFLMKIVPNEPRSGKDSRVSNVAWFANRNHRDRPKTLGRRQQFIVQLNQLIDASLLVLSLWLGHLLRQYLGERFPFIPEIDPFNMFLWLTVTMPFGPLLLDLHGFYKFPLQKSILKSLAEIIQALFWLGVLIAGCAILFRFDIGSRAVLIFFGIISTALLLTKERIVAAFLRSHAANGQYREKLILAGANDEIREFLTRVSTEQLAQIEVVESMDISLQPVSELVRALHQHSVGRVLFAASRTPLSAIQQAIGACEVEGVEAWLVADFIRTSIARPLFDLFGAQPMLVFRSTPDRLWSLLLKRVIDFFGALLGLLLLAPFLIIVAIAVKATSPGPVIFSQLRGGKHGKPFRMLKFRSMYLNAEQRRQELEKYNQMSGPVFKIDNDPRITPLGRWLRKYSIDELPQLINVLIGQMSLVGPRPLPIYEVENFSDPAQRRRLSVKPGITCLWQMSGRSEVRDFETWVKLDLDYIDNWSIWLDLRILLGTLPVVLLGSGAK
jgi:exopolysaccharide biosynthesis polyprenyl glycosylphosphotransferase